MPLSPATARVPRRIFTPIAPNYDTPAQVLGLFQYRRWHRYLLSRLPLESDRAPTSPLRILDMATGTGALALDLAAHPAVHVTGADITRPMLARALTRSDAHCLPIDLIEATAEATPFADASFDAVVTAYLLRYVSDVPATLAELARLVRPGGTMASLDFAVPRGAWYPLWRLYTDAVLPAGGLLFSPSWRRVGSFLGPSIRNFYRRWPEPKLLAAWRDAGFPDVRSRRLSLGGAIVIWGAKA